MAKFKITTTSPTPLLQDFHTYLAYLMQHQPIVLTTKAGHLPPSILAQINPLLQCANKGGNSPKSKQTRCYLIHLFFHLGWSSELFSINYQSKTKRILEPNLEVIQRFTSLNPTEQYIYLLKTLLVDVHTVALAVTSRWHSIGANTLTNIFSFLFDKQWEKMDLAQYGDLAKQVFVQRIPEMKEYALYLSWFGFWKVTIHDTQPYYNIVQEVQLTSLGYAMAEVLHYHRPVALWNRPYQLQLLEELRFEHRHSIMREPFDEEEVVASQQKATEAPYFLAFVPLFEEGLLREDSFLGLKE